MRETIIRNRKALGLSTNEVLIDSFVQVNQMVNLDIVMELANKGTEYILADGLVVGYGMPTP